MKRFNLCLAVLLVFLAALLLVAPAMAGTTNPSPASPGYEVIPLFYSYSTTATVTMERIKVPFPYHVVSVTASCESADYTDTDETYTVDVKEAGTSILSAPIGLAAAATVYDGTVSDAELADESILTVVLTVGGTTPSINGVDVLLVLKRE